MDEEEGGASRRSRDIAELLSIEEAAARLGIAPRTLRDQLKRDEYAGRTVRTMRRTKTGDREATMVPAALFAEIAAQRGVNAGPNVADNPADVAAEPGRNGAGNAAGQPITFHVPQPQQGGASAPSLGLSSGRDASTAELIEQMRQQIADLERQREEDRAERARLLDALQLAQENLGREQTLRREELRALPPVQQPEEPDRGNGIAAAGGSGPGRGVNSTRARLVVSV